MKITIFKSTTDTKNPQIYEVDTVLDQIKKCSLKKQIEALRAENDEKKRVQLKLKLPNICFSGVFTERKDSCLKEHSGLCVLDIDHIGDYIQVSERKAEVVNLPYVYACFVSPSGDGLKVIVRIPAEITHHRGYYTALMRYFPQADSSSINESRVCFASADPDIYINKNAVEFTEYDEPSREIQTNKPFRESLYTDYKIANVAIKMIRDAADGDKYPVLLKAAALMGGYIAGGSVQEDEGVRLLEKEIMMKDINDFKVAQKAIKDAIEYGKTKPIVELFREARKVQKVPKSDGVKVIDAVWENMKHTFLHGKARGTTTHFPTFDNNFTWKQGEITLFIGRPNAGKSEFMYQLMLMKSHFDGWKWAVFTPENHPADEFYDTMIHAYIGKTTDPYYKDQQMTMEEYERGYEFVKKHFFYVYPPNPTMEEIESNFIYLIEREGVCGTFIDPFNHISLDWSERDDKMLRQVLTDRKRFAVKYNTYDVISAHPKNMAKTKDGNYEVPDIYDISGGAMWGNKMDNIVAVHRPNYITDPADTLVEIHVKKIKKQKLVGIPGMSSFHFSRKTNRYYQDEKNPLEGIIHTQTSLRDFTEPIKVDPNSPFLTYE